MLKKQLPLRFILFACLIFLTILIIENINGRFWLNDFKVYYLAAKAFVANSQVYDVRFGLDSGLYKYSPFTLLLFVPLSFLPYPIASVLFFAIISAAAIGLFLTLHKIFEKYLDNVNFEKENLILFLALLCSLIHLVRELHLGNTNVILLFLMSQALWQFFQNKIKFSAFLIALVLLTKPFFILILIPFLLRKNFKLVFLTSLFALLFSIIPTFFIGLSNTFLLHKEWLHTLLQHNDSFPSNNNVEGILLIYFTPKLPELFSWFALVFTAFFICLLVLFNIKKEKNRLQTDLSSSANLMFEWFLIIALMPTLFRTDTEHFLLSIPLILLWILYLFKNKNIPILLGFILLMFFYGGNSGDLLGKKLSSTLDSYALLGISNLLLLIGSVFLWFNLNTKKNSNP